MARYISQEQIQPGPLATKAPIWKDIHETAMDVGAQYAERAGAVAGLQPGFTPGIAFTKMGASFQDAALKAHTMMLTTDISQSVEDITQKIGQNMHGPSSLDDYNRQVKTYKAHILQETPDQSMPLIKNTLDREVRVGYNALQNKVIKQQHVMANTEQQTIFNTQLNDIGNTARSGDRAAALTKETQLENSVNEGITNGTVTNAKQAEILKNNARKAFVLQYSLGRFQKLLDNPQTSSTDLNKYIDDHRAAGKGPYKNWVSPNDIDATTKKMYALVKEKERMVSPAKAHLTSMQQDAIFSVRNGQDPSMSAAKIATLQQYLPPDKLAAFQEKISEAHNEYASFNLYAHDSIDDRTKEIAKLQDVGNKSRSQYESDSRVAKKLMDVTKAFRSNPFEVVKTDPSYQRQIADMRLTTITANKVTNPALYHKQTLEYGEKVTNLSLHMQKEAGATENNFTVLGSDEVKNISANILNAPTITQGLQELGQIEEQVGPAGAQYALRQLQSQSSSGGHLPVQYGLAVGMPPAYAKQFINSYSKAGVERSTSLDKTTSGNVKAAVDTVLDTWIDSTYSLSGNSDKYVNEYKKAVTRYALYLTATLPDQYSDADDAAQDAANRLILNKYAPDGVNKDYRVPAVDEKSFNASF